MNRLIRIALTFLLVMTSGVIQAEIVIIKITPGIRNPPLSEAFPPFDRAPILYARAPDRQNSHRSEYLPS